MRRSNFEESLTIESTKDVEEEESSFLQDLFHPNQKGTRVLNIESVLMITT
jgi:hypothetical protein